MSETRLPRPMISFESANHNIPLLPFDVGFRLSDYFNRRRLMERPIQVQFNTRRVGTKDDRLGLESSRDRQRGMVSIQQMLQSLREFIREKAHYPTPRRLFVWVP